MNKRKAFLALIMVCALCILPLFGSVGARASEASADISDLAGVLSSSDYSEALKALEKAADKTGLAIGAQIVNTIDQTGKSSAQSAADYYSESTFGTSGDIVVFFVALEDGKWQFSTTGLGIKVMYDNAQVDTWADMQDDVKSGNLVNALKSYAESVISFKTEYDESQGAKPGMTGIIAVVVGAIAGLIRGGSLKNELKSVAVATTASDCVKKDSFKLTRSADVFLYRTVERNKRSTEDKSSSTHVSESGTTHGGIGGSF